MLKNYKYAIFFFDPDDGSNAQGGTQQQQQQTDPPVDPFKDIDKDLLDDKQREAFEKIERSYKDLQGHAKQASTYQSELDRTKVELARQQEALQSLQKQGNGNGNQSKAEQTLEDEMFDLYKNDYGLPEEQARKIAKVEVKKQGIILGRYDQHQSQRLAPMMSQVVDSAAQESFLQAMQNDKLGYSQDPELQQKLWDQVQALSQNGQMVNPAVVQNFARIYWAEKQEAGGGQQQQQVPPLQQQRNGFSTSPLQTPNGTFPRNGGYVRPPNQTQDAPISPELQAAMGATMVGWPVKPKAFKNMPNPNKMHITRNGQ